jgi:hypothetical protein
MMTLADSMSMLKGAAWRDSRRVSARRNWSEYATVAIVRLRALAPYAHMELILPGGSLMALLLWLYRRRKSGTGFWRGRRGAILGSRPIGHVLVCEVAHSRQVKGIGH